MNLKEQQEAARVEIDKQFARDFATDAVYSDKELIEVMSNVLKANADWVYAFADTLIDRTRQETLDAVKAGMPEKLVLGVDFIGDEYIEGFNSHCTAILKHLKSLR